MSLFPSRDVFVDTSFWYAAHDPSESQFGRAQELLATGASEGVRLHVTREVLGETLTLLG